MSKSDLKYLNLLATIAGAATLNPNVTNGQRLVAAVYNEVNRVQTPRRRRNVA